MSILRALALFWLLRQALRLARILIVAAVLALLWPVTGAPAGAASAAWLVGWPRARLRRATAWSTLMAVVWVVAAALRGRTWKAVALAPVGLWHQASLWLVHGRVIPAEFDGQVIRQWIIKGDDDTPDRHCVAIDDGMSARARALTVSAAEYPPLTPGTFVHVRVNPRRNRPLGIQPTEPAPVAPRLAAVVADQPPAGEPGLPDPAALVTEHDAAAVLGGPVRGTRLDGGRRGPRPAHPAHRPAPAGGGRPGERAARQYSERRPAGLAGQPA